MRKFLAGICLVLFASSLGLGLYAHSLRWRTQDLERSFAGAQDDVRKLRARLAAAEKQLHEARATQWALEKRAAEAEATLAEEVEQGTATEAVSRRDATQPLSSAQAVSSLPPDEGIERKSMLEVLKGMYDSPSMQQGMKLVGPVMMRLRYGKLMDRLNLTPSQRADLEKKLAEFSEKELAKLQEAVAALPDLSQMESWEAERAREKLELLKELAGILDAEQFAEFEAYFNELEAGDEAGAEAVADLQIKLAGLDLTEDQAAAFKEVLREELVGGPEPSLGPTIQTREEIGSMLTMTVGDFLQMQREKNERVLKRLKGVLTAEQLAKYGALQELQREQMKLGLRMLSGEAGD